MQGELGVVQRSEGLFSGCRRGQWRHSGLCSISMTQARRGARNPFLAEPTRSIPKGRSNEIRTRHCLSTIKMLTHGSDLFHGADQYTSRAPQLRFIRTVASSLRTGIHLSGIHQVRWAIRVDAGRRVDDGRGALRDRAAIANPSLDEISPAATGGWAFRENHE